MINVSINEVSQLDEGIWRAHLSPKDAAEFGVSTSNAGTTSVVLVDSPTYDVSTKRLSFPLGAARLLNLGSHDVTVLIAADRSEASPMVTRSHTPTVRLGFGDREFLKECEKLGMSGPICQAAREIVEAVRSSNLGDLERNDVRKFVNRPDNFWAVVPQPRANALHITVRGGPASFGSSEVDVKPDMNGYSAFKVRKPSEVTEALRIINAARRKPR